MRRVLVIGAGFFGRLVARRLRDVGVTPLVASRHGPDLRLDAEDEASLRAGLMTRDIVIDTAGPFADRTARLAKIAIDLGCDVIDISESLPWSEAMLALHERAVSAGTRLYPACSTVAAVAGACVIGSGIREPASVDLFLAPTSADTATRATVSGMTASIGWPVRTLRDGSLTVVTGYRDARRFPASTRQGRLIESAAAVLLPRSWPSLRRAELWVDPNVPFAQAALSLAARVPPLAALVRSVVPRMGSLGIGRHEAVVAFEVRDTRRLATYVFRAPRRAFVMASEPAVIVAERLARGERSEAGVVLPHAQVQPDVLFARLRSLGIAIDTAS